MTRSSLYRSAVGTALILSLVSPSLAMASNGAQVEARGGFAFGRTLKAEIRSFIDARKEARREHKEEKKQERKEEEKPAAVEPAASCMKPAVTKREDALVVAGDAYATSMRNAHMTRRTSLLAAWDLTDATARRTAISAAWDAYGTSTTAARKTFINSRTSAWTQFSIDRKACGQEAATLDEVRASVEVRI